MKKHHEMKWSDVTRRATAEYLTKIEARELYRKHPKKQGYGIALITKDGRFEWIKEGFGEIKL